MEFTFYNTLPFIVGTILYVLRIEMVSTKYPWLNGAWFSRKEMATIKRQVNKNFWLKTKRFKRWND